MLWYSFGSTCILSCLLLTKPIEPICISNTWTCHLYNLSTGYSHQFYFYTQRQYFIVQLHHICYYSNVCNTISNPVLSPDNRLHLVYIWTQISIPGYLGTVPWRRHVQGRARSRIGKFEIPSTADDVRFRCNAHLSLYKCSTWLAVEWRRWNIIAASPPAFPTVKRSPLRFHIFWRSPPW